MLPSPRPAVGRLVPYEPGRPIESVRRELGLAADAPIAKLASNESPFGPFAEAAEAMAAALRDANRYPDGGMVALREALAERHRVPVEMVAVGNGADALIKGLSLAYLAPGDEVVCGWPSFPSYVIGAALMDARAVRVPLGGDGVYDLPAIRAAVTERTRLVYLCTPNNPTGGALGQDAVAAFLADAPAGALTVVDEAYHEYAMARGEGLADAVGLVRDGAPAIVLRSFSKLYALAGLRVGYGIGPADVVAALDRVRSAFDVSSVAQAGALASLAVSAERVAERVAATAASLERLRAALGSLGARLGPDHANFVYADLGRPGRPVFDALLREGIIVRPLDGFGAPDAIRVSAGTPNETDRAVAALGRVLGRDAVAGAAAR